MPTVYMMIGVPASGKSTAIKGSAELKTLPVASSDDYIQVRATITGRTYDEVFGESIDQATKYLDSVVETCIKGDISFIWDQTNLTKKSRTKKLSRFPKHWKKIAVYLATPEKEEWERRLASRPGKTIPKKILESMLTQLEPPDLVDEDFDRIISNVPMD